MQLIIQVVVLTIFAVGTTLAAGNVCLPGCSNCTSAAVISCCDGMAAGSAHIHELESEHRSPSGLCPHGEICPGEFEQAHELIVQSAPSTESCGPQEEAIVTADLFERASLTAAYGPAPSDVPPPPLYISNCSFLI